MHGLAGIPLSVEPVERPRVASGNCLPILHEIRHGLKRLAESGESTLIDLSAIPFGPGDEERLLALLGRGEVQARVDALGPTQVLETAVHGVWLVDYRNEEDQRLALHIEIASVPDTLRAQPRDVRDAIELLDARIEPGPGDSNSKS
jgi:hydrogenase-1 operon protein HyaF